MESLPQAKVKEKLIGRLQVKKGRHPRSAAKLMLTTSLTSELSLPCGEHRFEDRQRQNHGAQLEENSKAFEMHNTAHPCEALMLRLAESRSGHANGALVSASDSEVQAALQMMQQMTCGRMSGERFSMKRTDHSELLHSCSTANAYSARAECKSRAKNSQCK